MKGNRTILSVLVMSVITVLTLASCGGGNTTSSNDSVGPDHVTAAPNASVVTAKVLDVIEETSRAGVASVSWQMVVEIQAAEIAPGFSGGLTAVNIGQTFTMWTNEDVSELEKGDVLMSLFLQ